MYIKPVLKYTSEPSYALFRGVFVILRGHVLKVYFKVT